MVYSDSAQLVQALRFQCCDCRGGGGGRRNADCHEEAPRHFAFGRLPVASNPQFPCWHSVVILGRSIYWVKVFIPSVTNRARTCSPSHIHTTRKDEGEVVVIFSLTHTHFTKIQRRSSWGNSSNFDDARSKCATMLLNTCHPPRHDTHAGCLIPEHFTYTSLVCPTPERGKKSDPAERKQNVTRSSGLLARNSFSVKSTNRRTRNRTSCTSSRLTEALILSESCWET